MKKRTGKYANVEYTDGPLGELVVIENFLPPPDQLVFTEEKTRVTINLNQSSIDFFKVEAKRHRTQYQKIIRSVLDRYVKNATVKESKKVSSRAAIASPSKKIAPRLVKGTAK
jgi:hypothetical protein